MLTISVCFNSLNAHTRIFSKSLLQWRSVLALTYLLTLSLLRLASTAWTPAQGLFLELLRSTLTHSSEWAWARVRHASLITACLKLISAFLPWWKKNNPKSSCNIQPHSLADSLPSLSLHHTLYFSYPLLLMLLKNHCPFVPLPVILATQHSPTDPFWTPPYPESQMVLVSGNLNHSIAPVISYMPLTVHSHLCEQEDLSVSYTWSDT